MNKVEEYRNICKIKYKKGILKKLHNIVSFKRYDNRYNFISAHYIKKLFLAAMVTQCYWARGL